MYTGLLVLTMKWHDLDKFEQGDVPCDTVGVSYLTALLVVEEEQSCWFSNGRIGCTTKKQYMHHKPRYGQSVCTLTSIIQAKYTGRAKSEYGSDSKEDRHSARAFQFQI